ncbi:MAG: hypothetical protein BWK80_21260 [Desulfobacteraceae bacterium IS3]|nr:MAG: hypothetical protein BWK80_21260 [Desulfobacteraceae bacterium IS3]
MGKKNKKKKKLQKVVQSQVHELTQDQLLEKGAQELETGKARDAIATFKIAAKKHGMSDTVTTSLFRAYLMRESQLRQKNMLVEAEAMKKQAEEYMPEIRKFSEKDLLAFIFACSTREGFDIYAKYTAVNRSSPAAEQFLANRLFKSGKWDFIEKSEPSLPLRRDAGPVKKAMPLMNEGKWEEALEVLGDISRQSPFAPIRMFCRAMVCFYKQDDADMLKALSMIPDDFPLADLVNELKEAAGGNPPASPRFHFLWEGTVNMKAEVRELLRLLEEGQLRQSAQSIIVIADAAYPRDPLAARVFILEILWNLVMQDKIADADFHKLVLNLIEGKYADTLLAKTRLTRSRKPLHDLGRYISFLETEFPEPQAAKIAHSTVLSYTAHLLGNVGLSPADEDSGFKKYKKLLGIRSEEPEMILVDMIAESVRLDPLNRAAYQVLTELPRFSRAAKNGAEAVLTDMLGHFPDDPFPCLELAALYYEKNAFRKAENILEEAMKRAPHDSRVIDRNIIALLVSAEKNIQREKFHLVAKDIEKSENLKSRKLAPFIAEKRILCRLISDFHSDGPKKPPENIMSAELEPLPFFEQLRILSVLVTDIKEHHIALQWPAMLADAEKLFEQKLKKSASSLSSSDWVRLLMPLEKDFASLFPFRQMAPVFLKKHKNILKGVADAEIFPIFDTIFEPAWFDLIQKEIKRRTKTANPKDRLLLEFYLVTVQHITAHAYDAGLFENIIGQASGPLLEELRTTSRRLSKYAAGVLKNALEMFDFGILEELDDDGDFRDEDDDFFPEKDIEAGLERIMERLRKLEDKGNVSESEFLNEFIAGFESFVDTLEIRGAPELILFGLREMLRVTPGACRDFDELSEAFEHAGIKTRLSREARLILFGKKGKS